MTLNDEVAPEHLEVQAADEPSLTCQPIDTGEGVRAIAPHLAESKRPCCPSALALGHADHYQVLSTFECRRP